MTWTSPNYSNRWKLLKSIRNCCETWVLFSLWEEIAKLKKKSQDKHYFCRIIIEQFTTYNKLETSAARNLFVEKLFMKKFSLSTLLCKLVMKITNFSSSPYSFYFIYLCIIYYYCFCIFSSFNYCFFSERKTIRT